MRAGRWGRKSRIHNPEAISRPFLSREDREKALLAPLSAHAFTQDCRVQILFAPLSS